MKRLKFDTFSSSTLPIQIFYSEIEMKAEATKFELIFDTLKQNKFNVFGRGGYGNYSNYNIEKIALSDFLPIDVANIFDVISEKLKNWTRGNERLSEFEFEWFIGLVKSKLGPFIADYTECYVFDLPVYSKSDRRHHFYSLYEIFFSVIFFNKESVTNNIFYVEMFYS